MYLADTSAWIEFTRKRPRPIGHRLKGLLVSNTAVFVCGPVVQELLQGAVDELRLHEMRRWLMVQRFVGPTDPATTYAEAGTLYARCRWSGLTPRSSNDCLIASIAIEHGLTLLHDDADFEKIAQVEPRLKLA